MKAIVLTSSNGDDIISLSNSYPQEFPFDLL